MVQNQTPGNCTSDHIPEVSKMGIEVMLDQTPGDFPRGFLCPCAEFLSQGSGG